MQEWVRTSGARLVVGLRGPRRRRQGRRDQARHGVPQPPRSAASSRCPAPTERQRTQWYFQRYIEHLPAAGEIVLLDRSWYNRAGVERVMGFCHARRVRPLPAAVPGLRGAAGRGRDPAAQVLVLGQRRRAGAAVPRPDERPDAAVEALPDGPGVDHPLGGLLARQGRDVRPHRHRRGAVVRRGGRGQAPRPDQHDRPPALQRAVAAGASRGADAAQRPPARGYQRPPREQFHEVPDHASTLE